MTKRVFNFSAGPATLPEEVLERCQKELLNYEDSGMSVMEMSHRSKLFQGILDETEARLRNLMALPNNYRALFLQGGATQQFSAVPLNICSLPGSNKKADYLLSGVWSEKAYKEASRFIDARVVASSKEDNYTHIPKCAASDFAPDADYVYICENNTIYGTAYNELPDTGSIPLVSDMSSLFLSRVHEVERYGVIFAGAQKNIGPAGITIVIIRDDLMPEAEIDDCPVMLNWRIQADAGSMYNTPNCWGIYVCGEVFKWIEDKGGLGAIEKINEDKATLLYDYLDSSKLFTGTAAKQDRSLMNVDFVTGSAELDERFVKEAAEQGLVNLKGYRTIGGMRASIYNAMPKEGVEKLVDFMKDFETSV